MTPMDKGHLKVHDLQWLTRATGCSSKIIPRMAPSKSLKSQRPQITHSPTSIYLLCQQVDLIMMLFWNNSHQTRLQICKIITTGPSPRQTSKDLSNQVIATKMSPCCLSGWTISSSCRSMKGLKPPSSQLSRSRCGRSLRLSIDMHTSLNHRSARTWATSRQPLTPAGLSLITKWHYLTTPQIRRSSEAKCHWRKVLSIKTSFPTKI